MRTGLVIFFILSLFSQVLAVEKNPLIGWWVADIEYLKGVVLELQNKAKTDAEKRDLEYFIPNLERRAKKLTLIFTATETSAVYGDREEKFLYNLKSVEGNIYTLTMKGALEAKLVLEKGRLYDLRESGRTRPPVYMRRLSEKEIVVRKKMIADAKKPPLATAPVDDRLRFLIYKATPEQVDQLLKEQKDLVSIKFSGSQETALASAVTNGKIDLCKKLIAAGADVKIVDEEKENLLIKCATGFKPTIEIFDLLMKNGLDPKTTRSGFSKSGLLAIFCERGKDLEFLNYLIKKIQLDVNLKDSFGSTAITEVLENEWLAGADELIKNGADIKGGSGAVNRCGRYGQIKVLKYMAMKGVWADESAKTGLMYAVSRYKSSKDVRKNFADILKLYEDKLNEVDELGKTALFYAKEAESVKLLLEAGADKTVTNKKGQSLKDYFKDSEDILKLL